jgi:Domain of unknown function (DUF4136)
MRQLNQDLRFFSRIFTLSAWVFCALAITLTGCASHNKITQDFKSDTDFVIYKTFSWRKSSSEIKTANTAAMQTIVDTTLTQQGFQRVDTNADMLLDLSVITQSSSGKSTGVNFSVGLPIGGSGAIGLGTSKLLGHNNTQEGLFILDISTQKTNQIIWRGTLEAIPMNYFLLRNQSKLNAAIKKCVTQFPPKKN